MGDIAEPESPLLPARSRHRPDWDEYFFEVCRAIAKRATCDRGYGACVVAKEGRILATGYAGAPIGLPQCDEVGHLLKKVQHEDGTVSCHCMRTVHAEQNAICQAARFGLLLNGATLYCSMTPCRSCAMMIVNIGIERVLTAQRYHRGQEAEEIFACAGIELIHHSQAEISYPNRDESQSQLGEIPDPS